MYTDLFKITSIENAAPEVARVAVELNEHHKIFEGHFPGEPIMPGVCLIDMIKIVTGKLKERRLFLKSGKNIKFIAKIDPFVNKHLLLDLKIKEKEGSEFEVSCTTFFEDTIFFKFAGTFV